MWKPALIAAYLRLKMWKNYEYRKCYGAGNKYDDRRGLLG